MQLKSKTHALQSPNRRITQASALLVAATVATTICTASRAEACVYYTSCNPSASGIRCSRCNLNCNGIGYNQCGSIGCYDSLEPTASALRGFTTIESSCPIGGPHQCTANSCGPGQRCQGDPGGTGSRCVPSHCYQVPSQSGNGPVSVVLYCPDGADNPGSLPPSSKRNSSLTCQVGGRTSIGDPVNLSDQSSSLNTEDLQLSTTLGPISFERIFQSTAAEWLAAGSLGSTTSTYVPSPFGATNGQKPWAINWWHNWYSFAWPEAGPGGLWQVRLPGGELVRFIPCTAVPPSSTCTALPATQSSESRASLIWNSTSPSFTYVAPDGRDYLYSSVWNTGTLRRFFLTSVSDRLGSRQTTTVTYGSPPTSECATALGAEPGTGVPYIRRVSSADGTSIFFRYTQRAPSILATGVNQCVIRTLRTGRYVEPSNDAISYRYGSNDTQAGWLEVTENAARPYLQSISPAGAASYSASRETVKRNSFALQVFHGSDTSTPGFDSVHHALSDSFSPYAASSSVQVAGSLVPELTIRMLRTTPCTPPLQCADGLVSTIIHRLPSRTSGNGWAGTPAASEVSTTQVLRQDTSSRRTLSSSTLLSADIDQNPPLTPVEAYDIGTISGKAANIKVTRPRTDTTFTIADVPNSPLLAVTSRTDGRGSAPGDTETEEYSYVYLGTPPRQLVSELIRASVLPSAPAGSKQRKHFKYSSSGRLTSVIEDGWTRTLIGSGASDLQRFKATFFRDSWSSGGSSDPLGRTTEVQGPCWVNSASATSCTGSFPVTRYAYFPQGTTNNSSRLSEVRRYPDGPTGSVLVTAFESYDSLGNPGRVVDENGVATEFTYQENRPLTMTRSGRTWTYAYDRGLLTRVQRPAGDFDVICYRRLGANALAGGCDYSANPSHVPTAIFRYGAGAAPGGWYEATTLTYAVDGELREEAVYTEGNATTPFRRTTRERNPLLFETFSKTGPTPSGWSERTTRRFAADGLVVASGSAYSDAEPFCMSLQGVPNDVCTRFSYWNTGRLKQVSWTPLPNTPETSTCLDYDTQGNVVGARAGCGLQNWTTRTSGTTSEMLFRFDEECSIESRLTESSTPKG